MRLPWMVWVDPKGSTHPFKRDLTQRRRWRESGAGKLEDTGLEDWRDAARTKNASSHLLEAGRGEEQLPPEPLEEHSPAEPWPQRGDTDVGTPGSTGRANLSCFKPPRLWSSVTAAIES